MKILNLRGRNIRFFDNGSRRLKYVMEARFVKNKYTHVKFKNEIFEAKDVGEGVVFMSRHPITSF